MSFASFNSISHQHNQLLISWILLYFIWICLMYYFPLSFFLIALYMCLSHKHYIKCWFLGQYKTSCLLIDLLICIHLSTWLILWTTFCHILCHIWMYMSWYTQLFIMQSILVTSVSSLFLTSSYPPPFLFPLLLFLLLSNTLLHKAEERIIISSGLKTRFMIRKSQQFCTVTEHIYRQCIDQQTGLLPWSLKSCYWVSLSPLVLH